MSCKTIVSLLMAGFFLCAASASAAPAAAPHTTLTIAMGDPESSEMASWAMRSKNMWKTRPTAPSR